MEDGGSGRGTLADMSADDDMDDNDDPRGLSVAQEVTAIASSSLSSNKQLPDTPDLGCALRHRVAPVSELAQHNAGKR